MTNLAMIASDLFTLQTELDDATEMLIQADYDATESEHAFKMAHAKAYLVSTGTVQQREQTTFLQTEELRFDMEVRKQQLRAAKSRVDALRVKIDVARTLSAMTRSEMALAGSSL